jgi:hypothetical protein
MSNSKVKPAPLTKHKVPKSKIKSSRKIYKVPESKIKSSRKIYKKRKGGSVSRKRGGKIMYGYKAGGKV